MASYRKFKRAHKRFVDGHLQQSKYKYERRKMLLEGKSMKKQEA